MPAGDNTPVCPYCGANIVGGDHACQSSRKDEYFRGMAGGRSAGPEVMSERKYWDEQEKRDAEFKKNNPGIMESCCFSNPPWERPEEEDDRPCR